MGDVTIGGTGRLRPGEKPACFNRPDYAEGREVQDGWHRDGTRRIVWLPHRMTTHCVQHEDMGAGKHFGWDCSGCRHYDEKESEK